MILDILSWPYDYYSLWQVEKATGGMEFPRCNTVPLNCDYNPTACFAELEDEGAVKGDKLHYYLHDGGNEDIKSWWESGGKAYAEWLLSLPACKPFLSSVTIEDIERCLQYNCYCRDEEVIREVDEGAYLVIDLVDEISWASTHFVLAAVRYMQEQQPLIAEWYRLVHEYNVDKNAAFLIVHFAETLGVSHDEDFMTCTHRALANATEEGLVHFINTGLLISASARWSLGLYLVCDDYSDYMSTERRAAVCKAVLRDYLPEDIEQC